MSGPNPCVPRKVQFFGWASSQEASTYEDHNNTAAPAAPAAAEAAATASSKSLLS